MKPLAPGRVVIEEVVDLDIGQVWHVNSTRGNGSECVIIWLDKVFAFTEYIKIEGHDPENAIWGKTLRKNFNGLRCGFGYLRDETEEWYLTRAKREYHEQLSETHKRLKDSAFTDEGDYTDDE